METAKMVFPAKAQKWGILSLLFAVALCLFKWTPFSGVLSFVPLLGYLCIGRWGKIGLVIAATALLGLGVPFLFSLPDRLFFSCFLCALLTSYYLLYLEREESLSKGAQTKEERIELLQDLEKWKRQVATLKSTLAELEAKTSQEKRGLQREKEDLIAEKEQAQILLQDSLQKQERLQSRLEFLEKEYQLLQGSLYQDIDQAPKEEDLTLVQEWKHRSEMMQEELHEAKQALHIARLESSQWEAEALSLLKEKEESAGSSSQEIEALIKSLQNQTEENLTLEKQVDSLQELVSLLLPFAKTHLYKE